MINWENFPKFIRYGQDFLTQFIARMTMLALKNNELTHFIHPQSNRHIENHSELVRKLIKTRLAVRVFFPHLLTG